MGIVYSLGETDENSEGLREHLRASYSPIAGLSLMLWLLISAPCLATFAVTRRESGSWKWAFLQLGGLTVVGYLVALVADLFLDLSAGEVFEVRPALELNFDADADADMSTWGLYLRAPFAIYGRRFDDGGSQPTFHFEGTVGAYARVAPAHQLLLEYDMALRPDSEPGDRRTEIGGLAAGYNATLSDAIELVNQVAVDIPQGGEKAALSVMTGFIATMPSAADSGK
jgi:hypothetical protein